MSLKYDLDKFIPRKEQENCLEFIKKVTSTNPDFKFFLLNLPVGSGKSHLALMIADWYQKNVNSKAKFDIIKRELGQLELNLKEMEETWRELSAKDKSKKKKKLTNARS